MDLALLLRQNWSDVRRRLRRHWPRLNDDDVDCVSGSRRYLEIIVSERYATTEAEAAAWIERRFARLQARLRRVRMSPPGRHGAAGAATAGADP